MKEEAVLSEGVDKYSMFTSTHTVRSYVKKWSKIVLPHRYLRYYPPVFTLRNPLVSGIKRAFKQDDQVVVIAFNLANLHELADLLGYKQINKCKNAIKAIFKTVVQELVHQEDVIALSNFNNEDIGLLLRVDPKTTTVSDIETLIHKLKKTVNHNLGEQYPQLKIVYHTGYMFIEKKYEVEASFQKAWQQAIAMAEKRVTSEYNEMLFDINNIIEEKGLSLLAQPIIDVSTNEIQAWEMLSRGPKGTSLENPLSLFSVARQTGKLFELEMIVLEKAFKQVVDTGCRQNIFINFTPVTLGNPRLIREVNKFLIKYSEINPKRIILEITERDSIEGETFFTGNIKKLRALGFRLAIDDTGAGYASLHTISEIMPEIIKIDRSVIQNIDTNKVKESMLKGLLLIAKETGALVVAEGIENESEAAVLTRNKVDLAQGYFYARPGNLLEKIS